MFRYQINLYGTSISKCNRKIDVYVSRYYGILRTEFDYITFFVGMSPGA
jgi:hypothetical protein